VNQGRLYIATFTTVSTINKMPATQDKPRKAWIQPEDLPDLDTDSDSETSEESFWDYKGSDGSSQTEYSDLEDLADEESEEEEEEETDESEEEEGHPDSGDESDDESEVPKVGYKYKKVADKVRPQAIKYPEHLKPHRQFPSDPLKNLPTLPYHPPIFSPTPKITSERMADLAIDTHKELLPEERKLLQHVLKLNERSIAFDESERGTFRRDYFTDYKIPTTEHTPWTEKNIRRPQGHQEELIRLLREKIKAKVYEPAYTPYRSKWFYVMKKDGGLRIVHDLQKLNKVTIRDSAVPPILDEFVEAYAGRSVYSVLDMYWGFHARILDPEYRDLTAFQTPIGAFRLTSLPMGYANAPAEFQDCMMFILQDEIPHVAGVFIDDIPIKGPATKYRQWYGKPKRIPENPGIRQYIWEHLNDVHRILHRIGEAGGTVSAKKMQLCQAEVDIVGHRCSAHGRKPADSRAKKIIHWPIPKTLKELRGFLGICGTVRIWIKNFSIIAKPLVDLVRKKVKFVWGEAQDKAFNRLKELVTGSEALRPIDYNSENPIILSVDTSIHGIGFILSQQDEQGRRIPARYGSLPLKDVAKEYGQSKLELYGLFCALRKFRAYLWGAKRLVVEVDASSIRGMIDKPEVGCPTMNRWIQGILLFDFELVHIPGEEHGGPDALSRRRFVEQDQDTVVESDGWVDNIALAAQVHPSDSNSNANPSPFLSPSFPHLDDSTFLPTTPKISWAVATSQQNTDQDLVDILRYLVTKETPPFKTSREREQFLRKTQPFFLDKAHMYRQRPGRPSQVVIFPKKRRREILQEMHEDTAHHGVWAVEQQVAIRYYWPGMKEEIQRHVRSCHNCQLRSTKKMHLPVTVSHPPCLFSKVYLDVMKMPPARGKEWLVACRDDLSGITECKAIKHDRSKIIAQFFLKRIILRYGIVQEVVTDNGPSFGKEFSELLAQYGIRHIKISPYNSQANGVVERGHFNIREALVKLCDGDLSKWPLLVSAASYADRITTRRATGFSPFFLLHGVHPLMPGDLVDSTFLVNDYKPGMTSAELIEARARQLLRLPQDIEAAQTTLRKLRLKSKEAYERKFARRIIHEAYKPQALVLVRNNVIENSVSIERKTANRYMGPYQIVRQTQGGSYILAEMDGTLLRHHVAAYRLIPYIQREDIEELAEDMELSSGSEAGSIRDISEVSPEAEPPSRTPISSD
jgi:transposase InsO family protein